MLADTPVDFDTDAFKIVRTLDDGRSEILESQRQAVGSLNSSAPTSKARGGFSKPLKILGLLADFDSVFLDRIVFRHQPTG